MNMSCSHSLSTALFAVRRTVLSIMLLLGSTLLAVNGFAADAVSTKAPPHSVTIKAGVNDQASVSSQGSSETRDEDADQDSDDTDKHDNQHDQYNYHDDAAHHDMVQVFGDSSLEAGQKSRDMVSVFGSSTNEGEVAHDVVSVFGNTRVTGTVGHDAVAVIGNNYVNNKVDHDVVAVMGSVVLGPQAEIGHDVVAIGGIVKRDPAAIIHGHVQSVGPNMSIGEWLQSWVHNCLFKGRLLAFDSDVMWAWWIALIALLAYVLTAMLFPRAVDRCVEVMEQHPGHVVLAALLSTVGLPIVIVLLCITIIGIIAIPFVNIALLIAGFFGKVVILAWIGRRLIRKTESGALSQPALAVIVGGALVLLLYVVPVLSFICHMVLGFLGLGVAMYALLLEIKARRDDKNGNHPGSSGTASAADLSDKGHVDGSTESVHADLSSISTTATTALSELPRAGFWIRMIALLLDAFLIGAITSVVIHPKWFGVDEDHVIVTLLAIYGAVMWKLKGATIGDIICKLQVIRADGKPVDWSTAVVRSLSCFLSVMAIGLGFIWIAFDQQKQGWHDMIAGTLVVRTEQATSLL